MRPHPKVLVLALALLVASSAGTAVAAPGAAPPGAAPPGAAPPGAATTGGPGGSGTTAGPAAAGTTAGPGVNHFFRTMSDGVRISAYVVSPTGPGPHPVLIAPSSWSLNGLEYLGAAAGLAKDHGYVVVSYTSRGFWESGGTVQVAGPRDVADAREMIDWALTDLHGDPNRIGMFGISYGAGLSLLTASADPRVKAVAAMSGWADLQQAVRPNGVVNSGALRSLLLMGTATGRFSPELLAAGYEWWTSGGTKSLEALSADRSPITVLDQLNARRVPVMIAHDWQDTYIAPSDLVDYFDRLTGPKRLQLVPGGHAEAEAPGAVGIPNPTWRAATRWLDHHVRGVANGIDREPAVQLVDISRSGSIGSPPESAYRAFDSWAAVTTATERRYLSATGSSTPPGRTAGLGTAPSTGWSWTVDGAAPSIADARAAADIPTVDRSAALLAQTEVLPSELTLGGAPRLHVTVTSTGPTSTVFATLYELPPTGPAKPISYRPVPVTAPAGRPTAVDLVLEPLYTTISAGSRVALVIDTHDANYATTTKAGDLVTFSSPENSPAYLELPLG